MMMRRPFTVPADISYCQMVLVSRLIPIWRSRKLSFPTWLAYKILEGHSKYVQSRSKKRKKTQRIRVAQFLQVLYRRVFHPDSKNGLLFALRRIANLHSVPDGEPVFWPFMALLALDHFLKLATWKYKQNTTFGFKSFVRKLFRPALTFKKHE